MTHEEFLALAESQWEALSSLKEEKSFYEYEKRFEEIWLNYGRAVLEKSISDVSENRKKKKDNEQPNGSDIDIEDPSME